MAFRKYTKYIKYIVFVCAICLAILFGVSGSYNNETVIDISPGSNGNIVASELYKNNIIFNPTLFKIALKLLGKEKELVGGEFNIPTGLSNLGVIFYITNYKNIYMYKITIVEGWNIREVVSALNNNKILTNTISILPKEGSLMPDTYYFPKYTTRDSIIAKMQTTMSLYLDDLWNKRDKSLPYINKEQALIMASLVEEESSYNDERELIAGLFLNRLRIGMKLQTDPTVAYGLGKDNADKLTKNDLKSNTLYNTYIHYGLPPTPISNPSRASLKAVFNPSSTKYLYFVADGKGGHVFATNLVDHNANVSKWRAIEKARKKS